MSGRTSIIVHPKRTRFIQLHLDYLMVCGGGYAEAKTLSIFEHWTNNKLDHASQARSYNNALEAEGGERTQDESVWVYMGVKDLMQALLGEYSKNIANRALQRLVAYGFLESRRNPKLKYDNKLQYRLIPERVQYEIDLWNADPEAYEARRKEEVKFLEENPSSQMWDESNEVESGQIWDDVIPDMGQVIPDMGQVIPDMGQQRPKNGTTIPENTYIKPQTENSDLEASLRSAPAEEEKEEKPVTPKRARGARGGNRNANAKEDQPRSSSSAKNSSFAGSSNGLGSKAGKQGQQHPTPQAARPPAPPVDRRDPLNAAIAEALYPGLPLTERDWQGIDRARAELQVAQAKPEEIAPLVAWLSADKFWAERISPGALASQINKWRAATARQASAPESKDDMAARLKAKYGHRDLKSTVTKE